MILHWASRISGISFEVVLFCLLGYWGDRHWGTSPWLLLAGSAFGGIVAFWHLWKLVTAIDRANQFGTAPRKRVVGRR